MSAETNATNEHIEETSTVIPTSSMDTSPTSAEQNDLNNSAKTSTSRSSLIVNYLPQLMTQEEMQSLFSSIGQIESCKLIRDKVTRQSLAYGFVNYVNPEDAEKAIKMFNGLRLQNKTIKVSPVSAEQSGGSTSTKNSKMNLIVNYLPQAMTQEEMHSLFSTVGEVESCKLIRDKVTGQSLAYGFVNYVKPEDSEKAINMFNGLRLQNKTIKVSKVSTEQNGGSSSKDSKLNLIVNYLPQTMTEDEFQSLFSSVGEVESCKLVRDNITGQSLAYGFVNYKKPEDAEKAINTLNGRRLENKTIKVSYALPSSEAIKGAGLYIPEGAQKPVTLKAPYLSPKQRFPGPIHQPGYRFSRYSPLAGNLLAHHPLLKNTMKCGWDIFVYNLAPDTEDSLLWQLFGPFGAVQSVKVIRDLQTNTCKGFGFVTMTNYDEAEMAVHSLNGFTLGTRVLQVSFKTK